MHESSIFFRLSPLLALTAAMGCGGDDDGSASDARLGAPTSVPGCESHDHEPCAIQERECQERLGELAACAWGGSRAPAVKPPISFLSRTDYRQALYDSLVDSRAMVTDSDRWEDVWVRLGLASREQLSDSAMADAFSEFVAAYYDSETRSITMIEPDSGPIEDVYASAILVHEYVHALQDAADDLDALRARQPNTSDASWALRALIEGEADLHTTRVMAAMFGLDLYSLDFESAFTSVRVGAERDAFGGPSPLLASWSVISYGYGPEWANLVWQAGGRSELRALFASPPASFHEIFAAVHAEDARAFDPHVFAEPVIPDGSSDSVYDWDSLGPWGIHLLAGGTDSALALAWRGDQLAVFALESGYTAFRWQFELANSSRAAELAALFTNGPTLQVRQDGARTSVVASFVALPDWLLEPGE
jgi:hypothetical protein